MKLTIVPHYVAVHDRRQKRRLRELTDEAQYGNRSQMLRFIKKGDKWPVGFAVLAEEGDKLVGWAAVFGQSHAFLNLHVYVDPAHRGHGTGTALVREAQRLQTGKLVIADIPFFRDLFPGAQPYKTGRRLYTYKRWED